MEMKNLKDVLEKLRVDDISFNEFPADGTLDDIVEFLEDNNFIIIEEDYAYALTTIRKLVNTKHKRICFIDKGKNYSLLRFADTSKEEISIKNPIFIVVKDSNNYEYKTASRYEDGVKELNREEFAKLVNKHFSW